MSDARSVDPRRRADDLSTWWVQRGQIYEREIRACILERTEPGLESHLETRRTPRAQLQSDLYRLAALRPTSGTDLLEAWHQAALAISAAQIDAERRCQHRGKAVVAVAALIGLCVWGAVWWADHARDDCRSLDPVTHPSTLRVAGRELVLDLEALNARVESVGTQRSPQRVDAGVIREIGVSGSDAALEIRTRVTSSDTWLALRAIRGRLRVAWNERESDGPIHIRLSGRAPIELIVADPVASLSAVASVAGCWSAAPWPRLLAHDGRFEAGPVR